MNISIQKIIKTIITIIITIILITIIHNFCYEIFYPKDMKYYVSYYKSLDNKYDEHIKILNYDSKITNTTLIGLGIIIGILLNK